MFKVTNLSLSIGKKNILNNISFSFEKGERIALLGPNGSGKTSLLNCFSLINNYDGEIFFDKNNIKTIHKKKYFREIAFLFQDFNNFSSINVSDFIQFSFYPFEKMFSSKEINIKCKRIINELNIEDIANQKLTTLSGGELQKVKLAACLVKKPNAIFLDEIYNHLDPLVQDDIEHVLDTYSRNGLTIFLITHDLNKALLKYNRIISLKKGMIFFDGSAKCFISNGYLDKLYEKKFKIIFDENKQYIF